MWTVVVVFGVLAGVFGLVGISKMRAELDHVVDERDAAERQVANLRDLVRVRDEQLRSAVCQLNAYEDEVVGLREVVRAFSSDARATSNRGTDGRR